jgi:hypothetical protein
MKVDSRKASPAAAPVQSAPSAAPAPAEQAPARSPSPVQAFVAASSNPFTEIRAGGTPDARQVEQGMSLREARRTARAERVSNNASGGLSIGDRVKGLLHVLEGVGPASAHVAEAFRQMLDGQALGLPDWQSQVRRTLLGPDYPTTPQAVAAETQRIDNALAGPLSKLAPEKMKLIEQLRGLGLSDVDLFRGSHTLVSDNGALYDQWKGLGAHPRTSSHYPGLKTQQYEIELPGIGVMLFGKDKNDQTWFQMEAHGTSLKEEIPHLWNYVQHELSGHQNIGPMGYSPHSEKLGQELHATYPAAVYA